MMWNHYFDSILLLTILLISLSCTIHAEAGAYRNDACQANCRCDSNVPPTHTRGYIGSHEDRVYAMRDVNKDYRRRMEMEIGAFNDTEYPAFCKNRTCPGLGEAFYLPNVNAITALFAGTPIFRRTELGVCSEYFPLKQGTSEFSFTRSTEHLLNILSTETEVSASISSRKLSFGTTVSTSTRYSAEQHTDIMSSVMEKIAINGEIRLLKTPECYGRNASLDASFLSELSKLPTIVPNPSAAASWTPFLQFLKQYGSHVVTGQKLGSKFQRWDSLLSTETSLQREMQAKACAEIEGTRPGGGWSVSSCSSFSQTEKEDALHLDTRSVVNIVGGRDGPRKALIANISAQTLTNFIMSAGEAEEAIKNMFVPIWDVILLKFEGDKQMMQRSVNLRAAYEGWIAFKCPKLTTTTGVVYQEFKVMVSSYDVNYYGCWNKKLGCTNTADDCHVGGAGTVCYCYGKSCIEEKDKRSSVKSQKEGSYKEGVNISCYFKNAHCHCDTSSTVGPLDRFIWYPEN